MIVDGKALAQVIHEEVRTRTVALAHTPTLAVVTCAPNLETQKYLSLKQRRARALGIAVSIAEVSPLADTAMLVAAVREATLGADGVIVQLPLPPAVATEAVIAAIPPARDPDGFCYVEDRALVLPPVVGAIDAIAKAHHCTFAGKRVVVVGAGRLVGAPAAHYARQEGAQVTVITKDTSAVMLAAACAVADIIILGAGSPGLLTPEMVREGVVVFDAGTSEEGGVLVGDADPAVAVKASLFTPVPGGIGPLTIAVLLRNLVDLAARQ